MFALICCVTQDNQILQLRALYDEFIDDLIDDYLRRGLTCEQSILLCRQRYRGHLTHPHN